MKLHYYPDTDSLYIELRSGPGADSKEVSDGVVLDLSEDGAPVGIDIERASARLDLSVLETYALPTGTVRVA